MKEFLKTNTVTYNLMSFTGFKSILIFSLLLESPKSYQELQDILKNHEYLHETVSFDTLRVYLNSLREIGCNITKKSKNGITRYSINSHPFFLQIDDKQIQSIIKVYKALTQSIEVSDLIALQQFFEKFSKYILNEDLKEALNKVSPLYQIDTKLITELMTCAQNNWELTVEYHSRSTGKKNKNITILADKLHISNSKLYLYGVNSEYETYASFLVNNINKIISINMHNKTLDVPKLTVGYEYQKDEKEKFILLSCEKLINEENNKLTIEITSNNKFDITQRILSHNMKCKVIYPEDYRAHIISTLKQMKEGYIEKIEKT